MSRKYTEVDVVSNQVVRLVALLVNGPVVFTVADAVSDVGVDDVDVGDVDVSDVDVEVVGDLVGDVDVDAVAHVVEVPVVESVAVEGDVVVANVEADVATVRKVAEAVRSGRVNVRVGSVSFVGVGNVVAEDGVVKSVSVRGQPVVLGSDKVQEVVVVVTPDAVLITDTTMPPSQENQPWKHTCPKA